MFKKNRDNKPSSSNISLNAFYDHVIKIDTKTILITGWERSENVNSIKLIISFAAEPKKINNEVSIRHFRPDVNIHFNDLAVNKWGVFRLITFADPIPNISQIEFKLVSLKKEVIVSYNTTNQLASAIKNIALMDSSERIIASDSFISAYKHIIVDRLYPEKTPIENISPLIKVNIENSFLIKNYGVFLQGWMLDGEDRVISVNVKQGNTISDNLLTTSNSYYREDVCNAFKESINGQYKAGFYGVAKEKGFLSNQAIELVIMTNIGQITTMPITLKRSHSDEITALHEILAPIDIDTPDVLKKFDGFISDTIEHVWNEKNNEKHAIKIKDYGLIPTKPICSLIIPIYGRCDFLLYQIAQFSQDKELLNAEVIYVLDDPKIEQDFEKQCSDVFTLFSFPFKTINSGKNLGYAGANNIGTKYANSDKLLLLNSDVLPKYPGWLAKLINIYDSTDGIGVLGCKLLFEDETIQHDGLKYHKTPKFGDLWLIDHPSKGLPEWMVDQKGLHKTAAITGACLMINTALYIKLEGLDEHYILGDFEDSDLCLKCLEAGYQNYMDSSTRLYHLERQSQNLFKDKGWKFKLTLYNGVRHTKRWSHLLRKISPKDMAS